MKKITALLLCFLLLCTCSVTAFAAEPEEDLSIVRVKQFYFKPMTREEAVLQMNLLDHAFYVFRSMETNAVCVVYRRNNGGYGLIETEE